MAWNYEKGCDEPAPYNVLSGPLFTPNPNKLVDIAAARMEVHRWETNEAWLKQNYWRDKDAGMKKVTESWERAEMAVAGWSDRAKLDTFRRGYLEWLAKGNSVADQVALSDLEIEQLPLLERIIAKGYRELAKTAHPDTGGTAEEFGKLRTAKMQLDRVLAE